MLYIWYTNLNTIGMKKFVLLAVLGFYFNVFSQNRPVSIPTLSDSLKGFSMEEMNHHLEHFKGTEKEKQMRIQQSQRAFIDRKYKLGAYDIPKLVRSMNANARLNGNQSVQTANCTNIGFDDGTTNGWTTAGAGATNGASFGTGTPTAGDITITSGAGLDPYGNYPVVYAGAHSLQLSKDVNTSGNYLSTASRIISVPPTGNTFFNLNFAMDILDYPHTATDCAWFSIDFYDASGNILPCPQYQCYHYTGGDVGVSGFQQTNSSNLGTNIGGQAYVVSYIPWQTIAMDLTAYANSNVTCVVSCSWCLYNYDWAYCYIDANCPTTNTGGSSTCGGLPFTLNGPSGFDNYSWTPPPGNSPGTSSTSSINASVAGTYTLHASLNTCSTTAAYTFTYNVQPGPIPNFTNTAASSCSGSLTFTSTSSPNGGPPITNYTWEWGDGTPNGTGINSAHSFSNVGTNTVTLVVTNGACIDSISQTVVVPPHPISSFTLANNCLNAVSNFASTATAAAGIASQNWSFGDGNHGSGTTTSNTYTVAGSYPVTLVITDNNSCTDSVTHNIIINPLPTITANNPTICGGQQTGTITAGGAVTYTWNPTTNLTPITASSMAGSPTVTTVYTITGTDANGCVNATTSTITAGPLPPVTVNSPTICLGQQTATLTAGGAATYSWNPAAGLTPISVNSAIGSPAITTIYTVTGTDASGCVNTATTSITVNALPLPTATSNTPCASQQALVLNCPLNGMSSYAWSGPSSYVSPVQNPTITIANVTAAATGTYTVLVIDANSCINTATVNVSINPLPIVTVNSPTVCENQTINLSANGGISYSWSGPLTYSSSAQNPSINNASLNMAGGYTVVATDANNCHSGNLAQVTVNRLPVILVNTDTICLGQETATLTASGASTYTWSPAATLSSNTGVSVTGTPVANTNYIVTGTDNNGCVSDTNTSIIIRSLPMVTTSSVTPACAPLCPTLIATSNPLASSYTWNFSNGQVPSSTTLSPSASSFSTTTCFTVAGTYPIHVTVTDINGCINTATTIAVAYPFPVADFDYGPKPITILAPEVQFYNQSGGLISSYSWNFGDIYSNGGDTSHSFNPSYTYFNVDTFNVTLIVSSPQGCTSKVVKPVIVADTYAMYVPNAFSPNGDGTNDNFKAVGEGIKSFKLYVFDRWGNTLFYSDDINRGWDGTFQGRGSQQILQEDVYVWKISVTDITNKAQALHGTVTLLK